MRQVGRDALQLAGRLWRPPGSAPPRWRYVLDCSVEAPVTSQSSTMPPVRGHSREGPVVERLVAPCALCGCIHPLWFPRPPYFRADPSCRPQVAFTVSSATLCEGSAAFGALYPLAVPGPPVPARQDCLSETGRLPRGRITQPPRLLLLTCLLLMQVASAMLRPV